MLWDMSDDLGNITEDYLELEDVDPKDRIAIGSAFMLANPLLEMYREKRGFDKEASSINMDLQLGNDKSVLTLNHNGGRFNFGANLMPSDNQQESRYSIFANLYLETDPKYNPKEILTMTANINNEGVSGAKQIYLFVTREAVFFRHKEYLEGENGSIVTEANYGFPFTLIPDVSTFLTSALQLRQIRCWSSSLLQVRTGDGTKTIAHGGFLPQIYLPSGYTTDSIPMTNPRLGVGQVIEYVKGLFTSQVPFPDSCSPGIQWHNFDRKPDGSIASYENREPEVLVKFVTDDPMAEEEYKRLVDPVINTWDNLK